MRLHEHDGDRRLPRRGPARGRLHRRARDGRDRGRDRARPGRGAAAELHPEERLPVHHRDRRGVRLGRLRPDLGQGARASSTTRARSRGATRRARRASSSASASRPSPRSAGSGRRTGASPIQRTGSWESGEVRVEPTGNVVVMTGASPHGQGQETAFAQMAADAFGIDLGDVEVLHGDTDVVQHGVGTFGSRGLVVGGTAVHMAIEKVKAKAARIAAHLLDAKPEQVSFDGEAFRVANSDRKMTLPPGRRGRAPVERADPGRGAGPRGGRALRADRHHLPVRRAPVRGRDRRRHRRGSHRALRRRRRRGQDREPAARGRAAARRHHPGPRPGALRGGPSTTRAGSSSPRR